MKKLSRREMIRMIATPLPLLPAFPVLVACGRDVEQPRSEPRLDLTLGAFLDILLPADEMPSATDLGIHLTILSEGRFDILIHSGCAWLDREAQALAAPHYAALAEDDQIQLVELAEQGEQVSLQRQFFEFTLDLAYEHYYAREESWAGLGFSGPPQPKGYMDYEQPPRGGAA